MTFRHWLHELSGFSSRQQTARRHGPRRRSRPTLETLESRIVPSFKFVTGDTDGTIYAVDTSGDLLWYKDTSRNGSGFSFNAPNEGAVIGTGWNQFSHVIDGGNGVLYAIEPNGDLLWYKDTARNGTWGWDPNSGHLIGTGWNVFSQVVSGGNGMLYAIEPNGDLLWYRDLAQNGTPDWAAGSSNLIGTGWNVFIDVISNGNGILYGRDNNGNLLWYQDLAQNGTPDWAAGSGNVIISGWDTQRFSHILSGGEYNGGGIIYGIDDSWSVTGVRSTNLEFYKDLAQNGSNTIVYNSDGSINWQQSSGWDPNGFGAAIGYGWVYPTVEGYGSAMSVAPGGSLSFYVSTGGSNLTVTYLRLHVDPQNAFSGPYGFPQASSFQVAGQERPVTTSDPWAGAGWDQDPNHPADFSLTVPSTWQSGLYAAQVVDDRGYVLYIPFVVKPSPTQHNRIAVLVNTNTWDCYNDWGGRSRYNDGSGTFPVSLSFLRPDPAATPISNYHSNDHQTPGEVWFLSWLDNAGYSYDVYSDLDFDRGIPGLSQYQTLILDTHPEYWSASEYQNLQGYLNQGGDLLYLGGNGIFDMVEPSPDGSSVTVTTSPDDRYPSLFMNNGMDEGQLLGVDYYWAWDGHTGAPYQVSAAGASHFFFQGTGLQAGSLIGQSGIYAPASGWETDQTWQGGNIPGLQVLATGNNTDTPGADMTYYTTAADGFVLSVGSITFTNSLAVDPDLQAIVRNALNGILTYQMPAGTSENVTLRRNGDYLDLVDDQTGAIVASGPVGGVRSVRILGAAGQVEGLTLDYASGGYFPLQRGLLFDGGYFDHLVVVGGGNITQADYQPDSGTDGSGTVQLDGMPVGFTNLGLLSVNGVPTLIFDDSADPNPSTYVIDDTLVENGPLIPQVTFSGLSVLDVYGGTAADTFNVGSTSNTATTNLVTGPGNNTVNVGATSGALSVYNQGGTATVTVGGNQTNAPLSSIQGTVTVDGSGPTTLLVADSSDTRVLTGTVTGNDIGGLSPAPIFYGPGVTSLILDGGSTGDTYDIKSTAAGTVTTVNGGPGNDTFNITPSDAIFNNNDNFGNITGPLTVNGGGGADLLIIDDQNDTAADTYTIAAGSVQRTGSAGVTYTGMQDVVINGGSGGDTYNVNSTAAGTPVIVNAGAGNNMFHVGSGSLAALAGALTVNGSGGDTALVNDTSNGAATTYTVTSATLAAGGGFAGLTYSGLAALTLNGGSAADTYNIQSTGAATPVTANGGAGNDTFNVASGSNNLGNIQGALSVNGGGGTNTVNVNDQSGGAGQGYTLTATSLGRTGAATVTFGTIQKLTFTGAGGDTLTAAGLPAFTTVLNLGSGANTLAGPNASTTWTITGANKGTFSSKVSFLNAENLQGGTASDTFKFSGAGAGISGTVAGGGGGDKLDYSGNGGGAVTLNLASGVATSVSGGVTDLAAHFTSLTGSTNTANLLIGANGTNTWSVTGAGAGKLNAASYKGFPNLQGGSGLDIFKISNTGREASIAGGGAPLHQGEWLDYAGDTITVTVNLAAGTATGVTGSVSGIQNVRGGNGGNTLTGNAKGNILIGGAGADHITGGTGASILIGDKGSDSITGGSGGDILIGGYTNFDASSTANDLALMSILAEWQSADSYATRFHDINTGTGGGLNGSNKLSWTATVKDDGAADTLTAAPSGSALDWFFQGALDTIVNYETGEHVNNS
jgi:hypothetical protein